MTSESEHAQALRTRLALCEAEKQWMRACVREALLYVDADSEQLRECLVLAMSFGAYTRREAPCDE